ncbi:VOC family protein [Virgibacillus sp. 179-BFC.A HS]|uniref:VOC family protein n=1 Tax=Tigheibacillus jepli TaxID=3035914 RepID=A0ABU5CHD5_9BACI|nr:VOC family protein [Virgibacillus sp. 179-BFC.A HS]MDY0405237.1 VOC family protein [Virgibacillus sp. 179-BFC.A HS]
MEARKINHVGQIGIPVKDLNRALVFYKEKLGLSLLFNTDSMAFFECDGLRLMLTLPEKEEFAHPSSVIYFQVNNIKDNYKLLENQGVIFIDEPHVITKMGQTETWMVIFKDTEDNTHALMSEVQIKKNQKVSPFTNALLLVF